MRFCPIPSFPPRAVGFPPPGEGLLLWSNEAADWRLGVASRAPCGLILARIVYLESSICSPPLPTPLFFHLEESPSRGEAEQGRAPADAELVSAAGQGVDLALVQVMGCGGTQSHWQQFEGQRVLSSPLGFFRGPPPLPHSCSSSVGGPRKRTAGTCALVMLLGEGRAGTGCSPTAWRWGPREGCRIGPFRYQRPLGQPTVPAPLQALPHCWKRRLPALGASFQAADGDFPPGWDFPVSFLPRPGLGLVLIAPEH